MKKQIADGVIGALTIAVGLSLMFYGAGPLEAWGGLWVCLAGGYVGMGVFEGDAPADAGRGAGRGDHGVTRPA